MAKKTTAAILDVETGKAIKSLTDLNNAFEKTFKAVQKNKGAFAATNQTFIDSVNEIEKVGNNLKQLEHGFGILRNKMPTNDWKKFSLQMESAKKKSKVLYDRIDDLSYKMSEMDSISLNAALESIEKAKNEIAEMNKKIEEGAKKFKGNLEIQSQTQAVLDNIGKSLDKIEDSGENVNALSEQFSRIQKEIDDAEKNSTLTEEQFLNIQKQILDKSKIFEQQVVLTTDKLKNQKDIFSSIGYQINDMHKNLEDARLTLGLTTKSYDDIKAALDANEKKMQDYQKSTKDVSKETQNIRIETEALNEHLVRFDSLQKKSLSGAQKQYQKEAMINKLLLQRIKTERGIVAASLVALKMSPKLLKDSIGGSGKFGAAIVKSTEVAAGGIAKLGQSITALPGLGFLAGGLAGIVGILTEMDSKIKGMRKSIISVAGQSADWGKTLRHARDESGKLMYDKKGKPIYEAFVKTGSTIDDIRVKQRKMAEDLSLMPEVITEWTKGFSDAGFKLDDITENLKSASAISTKFGMDMGEVTGLLGGVREIMMPVGTSMGDVSQQIIDLGAEAANSGLTMTRFYQKTLNAATGLGVWGTKLTGVGDMMSWFTKEMKLPEKEAAEFAEKMIKGWQSMSVEQKTLVSQGSTFEKELSKELSLGSELTDARIVGFQKIMGWEGRSTEETKKMFKTLKQIPNNWDRTVRALNVSDVQKQIQTQYEGFLNALGIDPTQDMRVVASKLNEKSQMALTSLGKVYGLNSEAEIQNFRRVIDVMADKNAVGLSTLGKNEKKVQAELQKKQLQIEDAAIRKQTLPIVDAIKNQVEYWLQDIYTVLTGKIWPMLKIGFGWLKYYFGGLKGDDKMQRSALEDIAAAQVDGATTIYEGGKSQAKEMASKLDELKSKQADSSLTSEEKDNLAKQVKDLEEKLDAKLTEVRNASLDISKGRVNQKTLELNPQEKIPVDNVKAAFSLAEDKYDQLKQKREVGDITYAKDAATAILPKTEQPKETAIIDNYFKDLDELSQMKWLEATKKLEPHGNINTMTGKEEPKKDIPKRKKINAVTGKEESDVKQVLSPGLTNLSKNDIVIDKNALSKVIGGGPGSAINGMKGSGSIFNVEINIDGANIQNQDELANQISSQFRRFYERELA